MGRGCIISGLLMGMSLCGFGNGLRCESEYFWDESLQVCQPCSRCPQNLIISVPCGDNTDSVCRPFTGFTEFRQYNKQAKIDLLGDGSFSEEGSFDKQSGQERKKIGGGGVTDGPMIEKDDGEYWKNLAFALIGVVCVLIFVATVVVLMACRKLHETAALKRPDEDEDDDSGYVVIRAIRPAPNRQMRTPPPDFTPSLAAASLLAADEFVDSSSCDCQSQSLSLADQRLKGIYRPKRRLLNYDADDVFESEDSAGSRTSRKTPLQAIPEKSVSDASRQSAEREDI